MVLGTNNPNDPSPINVVVRIGTERYERGRTHTRSRTIVVLKSLSASEQAEMFEHDLSEDSANGYDHMVWNQIPKKDGLYNVLLRPLSYEWEYGAGTYLDDWQYEFEPYEKEESHV